MNWKNITSAISGTMETIGRFVVEQLRDNPDETNVRDALDFFRITTSLDAKPSLPQFEPLDKSVAARLCATEEE